ncbi:uncharacterized protein [Miscanthus floridulus]|uniref:uncharacterized protein n=1 Tax=Miscanthus floridulus TaxID=154761 RepID=UPI0034588F5C
MPEARALGKHTVSSVGSTAEVEQAAAGATQPPPQRVEGASESDKGWPAPVDTGAVPPPPPPPLERMRDAVRKQLCPRSSQKRQAEAPALAPHKVLKGQPEGASCPRRGYRGGHEGSGGEAPLPREAEAHALDKAEVPPVTEATEGEVEAPRTSEAEATEAGAPRTTKAEVAEAGVGAAKPVAQDMETEAGQASVPPLVQDLLPSQGSA